LHADSFSAVELQSLDVTIRSFLRECKTTFPDCSKSNFNFPKFHMATHTSRWIEMFGPLWVCDGNRWETFHTEAAKQPYQQTSKRNKRFHDEMVNHTAYLVGVSAVLTYNALTDCCLIFLHLDPNHQARLSESEEYVRPAKKQRTLDGRERTHTFFSEPDDPSCIFHGERVHWNCVLPFDTARAFAGSTSIIGSEAEHPLLGTKLASFVGERLGIRSAGVRHNREVQLAIRRVQLYKSITVLPAASSNGDNNTSGGPKHPAIHLRAAHSFNDVGFNLAACECRLSET
jgi:hypothetical protein